MAGVYDLPDDICRLKEKEIKGEEEYNEELKKKQATVDDDIFDDKLGFGSDEEDDVVDDLPTTGF